MKKRFYSISDKTVDQERAFYGSKNTYFNNIIVSGPADGESAFKESKELTVTNSSFCLRYPFWHVTDLNIENCTLSATCRAPFWYCKDINGLQLILNGVKAFRECSKIAIFDSTLTSEEIFWRCDTISIGHCNITGFYAFFECKDIKIDRLFFTGKYSFQYTENVTIDSANLNTKDAFWHSKNVTVKDSIIKGEYLGWYSENLTLINCTIQGTQPLCYCKGLKIVDCIFQDCDLSFENSEVNGSIVGTIDSIKNPLKGHITCKVKPLLIVDENDRSNGEFKLTVTK